jgi:hypothetical protein
MVSTAADRSGAQALAGSTIAGPVAVFVPAEADILWIEFHLDDPQARGWPEALELAAPYDYGGTRANGQANLVRFPSGSHTLTVRIVFRDGYVDVLTAAFTVS